VGARFGVVLQEQLEDELQAELDDARIPGAVDRTQQESSARARAGASKSLAFPHLAEAPGERHARTILKMEGYPSLLLKIKGELEFPPGYPRILFKTTELAALSESSNDSLGKLARSKRAPCVCPCLMVVPILRRTTGRPSRAAHAAVST